MKLVHLYEKNTQIDTEQTINWWTTNRHWYHPKTKTHYPINDMHMNHSLMAYEHPDMFGLAPGDLPKPQHRDYDGAILYRVMQNGWIRVFFDRRNPDSGINIEGLWFAGLADTLTRFGNVATTARHVAVVKRSGPGQKEGDVYIIPGILIDEFIQTHKPPQGSKRKVS